MSVSPLPNRTEVLARLPLFKAFNREQLAVVAERFEEVAYRRGETICAEGEEGCTFYVCLSGELEVWGGRPGRLINRLGPGDWFGEMALLLGGPRAATVKAARNTRLLALDKAVFEAFFLRDPKVLEYVSRVLSKRLATMARGEAVPKATTTIVVTGAPGLSGKTLVAATLAHLLRVFSGEGAVIIRLVSPELHAGDGRARSLGELAEASPEELAGLAPIGPAPPELSVELPDRTAELAEGLAALTTRLGEAFAWIVIDAGEETSTTVAAVADCADVLVRLVDAFDASAAPVDGGLRTLHVVNLHNRSSPPVPINHCEPFVIRDDPALRRLGEAERVEHLATNPRTPAAAALHRLARKILGKTVGIALGGGGAFGMTHLGVLKVLEEHGIPIDMAAGCSMGSITALGYAAGLSVTHMIELARTTGTVPNMLSALLDVTLTRPAFLTGDRLVKMLLPLVEPKKNFDELLLPCRVVATDIETGELVSITSGSFEVAGRASCAIPMIFAPAQWEGRVLVDGAVCDPVPVHVLTEMGADVTIAVNAVPHLRKGVQTVLSKWYRRLKRFDPLSYLAGTRDLPNMFEITMNTIQTLQHELGKFKGISADVQISPDLAAYTWVEFHRPQEFMDRGAEATERAMPEIERVLAERGRPRRVSGKGQADTTVRVGGG